MKQITATRYHDISCGHRVVDHEGKCALLHGHNYRVHFTCAAPALDSVSRIIDFSVMKSRLCNWLEAHWDHRFLACEWDPLLQEIALDQQARLGVVFVPFNPTAENIALHLLNVIGPEQLKDSGCTLVDVVVEETAKCSARAFKCVDWEE